MSEKLYYEFIERLINTHLRESYEVEKALEEKRLPDMAHEVRGMTNHLVQTIYDVTGFRTWKREQVQKKEEEHDGVVHVKFTI